MNIGKCEMLADEIRREFNPNNLAPFPYKNIEEEKDDLTVLVMPLSDEGISTVSGVTIFDSETNAFTIMVNSEKPQTRQNFTLGHELGHYFLHQDYLRENGVVVDDDKDKKVLYRQDYSSRDRIEIEADNFAAALLMPSDLVSDAWKRIGDIKECADIFAVSQLAMTIRLTKLGFLNDD